MDAAGERGGIASALDEFLRRAEALDEPVLGGRRESRPLHDDREWLAARLHRGLRANTVLVVIAVAAHVGVLVATALLALRWHGSTAGLSAVLGVLVCVVLGILTRLRLLVRDRTLVHLVTAVLPNLTPNDAVKVIQAIYYTPRLTGRRPD